MKTLSSCYFCGAALDAPLEEYPVVPSEFREGEPSTRATLCPGCHRKLETIFEEALPAASEGTLMDPGSASLSPEGDESPAEADSDERPEERSANGDVEESKMGLADADDVLRDPEQPTSPGEDEELETPDGADFEAPPDEMDETSGSGEETGDVTGEKPETETDDVEDESGVVGVAGDAEEGRPEGEGDEDEVTAEDIEAMAGNLDPAIVEDDESELADDDELGDAMEPDVPAAFQAGDDTGTDPEGEGSAPSEVESADESDEVEQVSAGEEPREDDQGNAVEEAMEDEKGGGRDEAKEDEQGDTGEETVEDAMEPDVPTEFQSGGGDESAAESESTEAESADEAAESDPAEPSEEEPKDDAEGESATTAEADAETGTDAEAEVSRSVSALEYNKVMRLLQNREFPVDRDEIETVAASAYELAESECAEVIDLAVDRGLLDEEDGKLIRP